MKAWFTENLLLKLIALLLALVLHLVVNEDREEVGVFFVDVISSLPPNRILLGSPVDKINVSIRGKRSELQQLRLDPPAPLKIDLIDAKDGIFRFEAAMLDLPPGLEVASISPSSMDVLLDTRGEVTTQVVPRIKDAPPPTHKIVAQRVEPSEVQVVGPQTRLDRIIALTEPINLSAQTETLSRQVSLIDVAERGVTFTPNTVTVTVVIEPIRGERRFEGLSVEVRDTRHKTELSPATVDVLLTGRQSELDAIDSAAVAASISAATIDDKPPGTWKKKVEIDNLPPGVEVSLVSPPFVTLTTRSADDEAPTPPPE